MDGFVHWMNNVPGTQMIIQSVHWSFAPGRGHGNFIVVSAGRFATIEPVWFATALFFLNPNCKTCCSSLHLKPIYKNGPSSF